MVKSIKMREVWAMLAILDIQFSSLKPNYQGAYWVVDANTELHFGTLNVDTERYYVKFVERGNASR